MSYPRFPIQPRAKTEAEALAARWPGNSRADFDAVRAAIRADVLDEVEQIIREIRARRDGRA